MLLPQSPLCERCVCCRSSGSCHGKCVQFKSSPSKQAWSAQRSIAGSAGTVAQLFGFRRSQRCKPIALTAHPAEAFQVPRGISHRSICSPANTGVEGRVLPEPVSGDDKSSIFHVAQPGLVHLSAGKRGAWKQPLGEAVKLPGRDKHKAAPGSGDGECEAGFRHRNSDKF